VDFCVAQPFKNPQPNKIMDRINNAATSFFVYFFEGKKVKTWFKIGG